MEVFAYSPGTAEDCFLGCPLGILEGAIGKDAW